MSTTSTTPTVFTIRKSAGYGHTDTFRCDLAAKTVTRVVRGGSYDVDPVTTDVVLRTAARKHGFARVLDDATGEVSYILPTR